MMIRQLYIASALSLFVLALTFGYTASAQNVTTNVSNATGNASAAAGNASAGLNQTGKNASELGGQILNKTEEVGKGLAGGLGSLLGNASEKLKESSK
jgi:hypothetical protein